MRVGRKGQVTIPAVILFRAGLRPGMEVEIVDDESGVHSRLARRSGAACDREVERALDRLLGSATIGMSTEDIMTDEGRMTPVPPGMPVINDPLTDHPVSGLVRDMPC